MYKKQLDVLLKIEYKLELSFLQELFCKFLFASIVRSIVCTLDSICNILLEPDYKPKHFKSKQ